MAKRTTTSCKNLRLVQIRKISNCLLISTNVLNMVFLLYLLHSFNLHSNWSFNVLSTSYMFMEFQYGEWMLQCFASEQEYLSRLAMQHWIQWACLDSNIALEYKHWQWWLDYWLFSITTLIFPSTRRSKIDSDTILIKVKTDGWTVSTKSKVWVLIISCLHGVQELNFNFFRILSAWRTKIE